MEQFKVFIASSTDEKQERDALKSLILKINEVISKYNVMILPEMWELGSTNFETGLEAKQNEYTQKLISSDIVFFIFGMRVGENTRIEFEEVCKQIKNKKPLKVYTYFKNVEIKIQQLNELNKDGITDIVDLKRNISKVLKQVYGEYETIAELQGIFIKEILPDVIQLIINNFNLNSDIQSITINPNWTRLAFMNYCIW